MNKKIIGLLAGAIAVIALGAIYFTTPDAGKVPEDAVPPEKTGETAAQPATETKSYTLADVASHAVKADCWMAVEGKVYDVTSFIPSHPGGEAILLGCGKDPVRFPGAAGHYP